MIVIIPADPSLLNIFNTNFIEWNFFDFDSLKQYHILLYTWYFNVIPFFNTYEEISEYTSILTWNQRRSYDSEI